MTGWSGREWWLVVVASGKGWLVVVGGMVDYSGKNTKGGCSGR